MLKKTLLFSVLSVAIVSCSGSNSGSSERYPSGVRTNYLDSCELSAGENMTVSEAENFCLCTLESLEASMSVDEFLEAEQAMMRGEASNIDMMEVAAECI